MADQAITALPKKTYSGSSQIASTDYLLGIDSAEGYQMLIQDLGEYIINRATASLAGSTQTLASAISALNSNVLSLPSTTNLRLRYRTDIDCNSVTDEWILGNGTNFPSGARFWYIHSFAYTVNSNGTINTGKQIAYGYSVDKVTYERTCDSGVWNEWTQLPTRAEMDTVKGIITSFTATNAATIDLAGSNRYGIIYILSGNLCGVYFVNTNQGRTAYIKDVKTIDGVSLTASGSTVTVSSSGLSGTVVFAPILL